MSNRFQINEAIIRERRVGESLQRKYTGPTGKLATIASQLGWEIRGDVVQHLDERFPGVLMGTDEYQDESSWLGYNFDALRFGYNFEIRFLFDNDQIVAKHEGKIVYSESADGLEAFAPGPWEKIVADLFRKACRKAEEVNEAFERQEEPKMRAKKNARIAQLKEKWGL